MATDEDYINPTNPEEIVREIFGDNARPLRKFSETYSKEVLRFSEAFSEAYKKYLSLERVAGQKDEQKAYVAGFVYCILNNLLVSIKLIATGNFIPSGNLMRQAIESIAVAILCSEKDELNISKNEKLNYFKEFNSGNSLARSHKALKHLELNQEKLRINSKSIQHLKEAREFYHQFSHPNKLSLAMSMSFTKKGDVYIGGCFDEGKQEIYKRELSSRIEFCKILPNFIENIETRLKTY